MLNDLEKKLETLQKELKNLKHEIDLHRIEAKYHFESIDDRAIDEHEKWR